MPESSGLIVENLHVFIATAHILQGVSLSVRDNAVAIIGRNGMGKTTLCDTLCGFRRASEGTLTYDGHDLRKLTPQRISRLGVAYVPQGRRLFAHLTVREHLALAFHASRRRPLKQTIDQVLELFPKLKLLEGREARFLSGGEQQMLAIARALLTQPSLLILDEPSEGLAPVVVESMVEALRRLAGQGLRILIVEQKLHVAAAMSEDLAVMINGVIVEKVNSSDFLSDSAAQQRLLGIQMQER